VTIFANYPLEAINGPLTALGAAVASTSTTTITTAGAAPVQLQKTPFLILIDEELMLVTAGGSGTSWTVVRGVTRDGNATVGATHASGAEIYHIWSVEDMREALDWTMPSSGEETMPRYALNAGSLALSSGTARLCYFRARRTEAITKVLIPTATTAHLAEGSGALVQAGVYSVGSTGELTLITATANNVKAMETANAEVSQALEATWNKAAGALYAYALLVVSTSMPSTVGANFATAAQTAGGSGRARLSGTASGLTTLPGTLASVGSTLSVPYAMFTP
jgi:hypothetical protein